MKNFSDEEDDTKDILDDKQRNELYLAYQTRNCYVHRGGKIDGEWIKAYTVARGKPIASEGEDLDKGINIYHEIEEWNELIVYIANKMKAKIESK